MNRRSLCRATAVGLGPLLALSAASAGTPAREQRRVRTFAGAPLDAPRAAGLARAGGFELIDFHPCAGGREGCALLAMRQPGGKSLVYQLSDKRCQATSASCLGGFTVTDRIGTEPRKPRSRGSAAKVSAKPGEDGGPSDPQHEAQANAQNEILESLGEGKYEGKEAQFWEDLESIHTWTNPSWIEPDPSPTTHDTIRTTGGFGKVNPAVLISGRYNGDSKECRAWVSYGSTSTSIGDVGNWISNAPFDGCDSEVAVFSEDGAAQLAKPERRWSLGTDTLDFPVGARIRVPTTVWVIYADTSYVDEKGELEREFEFANSILAGSKCGIELDPVTFVDKTSALADPGQDLGCGSIESIFKRQVGFDATRMNVYIVKTLIADDRAGVACTAESDNVIVLDQGRSDVALVHEYGHWFDLWHTTGASMTLVNPQNIMAPGTKGVTRNMMTAGQCYRANFSKDSYINKRDLRRGETKRCQHLQDADGQCPGVKNQF